MIARIVFVITVLVASPAKACSYPGSTALIFFDDIPRWFTGPTAARVSVIRKAWFSNYFVAQVHETIKGEVPSKFVRIEQGLTSCGPFIQAGDAGIVIGRLRKESGEIYFEPESETYDQRHRRIEWDYW